MRDDVIRFESKELKDPQLTAFVCRNCGNVELTIEREESMSSLFRSLDEGIGKVIRRGVREGSISGDKVRIGYQGLAQVSKVRRSFVKNNLDAYVQSRKQGVELGGVMKFKVSLADRKDGIIVDVISCPIV